MCRIDQVLHSPVVNSALRLLVLVLTVALDPHPAASSQTTGVPLIVGTWELVTRTVTGKDGVTVIDPVLGDRPTGRLVYDASGTVMLQMMRSGRKDAISAPANPQDKDNPRVILGYDAYFGRYTVDEKSGAVTHHVDGSLYPEDLGSNWVRPFAVKGDTLTLRFTSPKDGVTRTLVFRRLTPSGSTAPSKQVGDGKEWATRNLSVVTDGSYCYGDAAENCGRYGRLYTWEAAQRGCQSLGEGWRLPTNDEWRELATRYGGLREESKDEGRAAYTALISGGSSGFNAVFGGSRIAGEKPFDRLEAHGFYWTASETGATTAWFYNFGKGGASVSRHREGDKQMAASVRCVRP